MNVVNALIEIVLWTLVVVGFAGAAYSQWMLNTHHRKDKR